MNKTYQIISKINGELYTSYYSNKKDTISYLLFLYVNKDIEIKDIQFSKKVNSKYKIYSNIELINFILKELDYETLFNETIDNYNNDDINSAYKSYEELNSIYLLKNELATDEKERYKNFCELQNYLKGFRDDLIYTLTDYGKQKAYKQMELEKTYNIIDESVKLYDLTKNEDMKELDNFLDFYEWCILTSGDKYNLYDLQTNEYKENKEDLDFTLEEIIDRIVGRALDYELNEHEFEDYIEDDFIKYLKTLHKIAMKYNKDSNWLSYTKETIDELEKENEKWLCVKCGKVKEEYESMYCDKCFKNKEDIMNKQEIKELIHSVEQEFDNELDFDYDYNGKKLTDDDLNMISNAISDFCRKLCLVIDDDDYYLREKSVDNE